MTVPEAVYTRKDDRCTVYLKNVITRPNIEIGAYTMYQVWYKTRRVMKTVTCFTGILSIKDKMLVGKFCSVACGAKFIFNAACDTLDSFFFFDKVGIGQLKEDSCTFVKISRCAVWPGTAVLR